MRARAFPRLQPGALLGVVALSGPARRARLAAGSRVLRERGYRLQFGRHVLARRGYLAGPDRLRVGDLNRMLRNPQLDGIIFARGGYGALRILDQVDWAALRRYPKLLVGFSDLTALFAAARVMSGLPTLHAPTLSTLGEPQRYHAPSFWAGLTGRLDRLDIKLPASGVIRHGVARGELAGGCLSLLGSLVGTRYQPDLRGRILFWEEVNEEPFRIDRLLQQIRLSGILRGLRGVVVGRNVNCRARGPSLNERQILEDLFLPLGVPVVRGVAAGHCLRARTLPLGVPVRLDTRRRLLSFTG